MSEEIQVRVMGEEIIVSHGTSLISLAEQFQGRFKTDIVLSIVDNHLKELNHKITEPCDITLLDTTSKDGYKAYQRGLSFVMMKAIYDELSCDGLSDAMIHFAINEGFYCEFEDQDKAVDEQFLTAIKGRMTRLIEQDLHIEKHALKISKVKEIFRQQCMTDKLKLFTYRRSAYVNVCKLDGFYDYFYGQMVPRTGCLSVFDIQPYENGWILQFMNPKNPQQVATFNPYPKLFQTLKQNQDWDRIMEVENVGDLNQAIVNGDMNELILVSEALMEKRIGHISDQIIADKDDKKFVFIAGPSSSGKTTFAHRLAVQLRAHGVHPHIVSVDNYFVNRDLTPKDESGRFDFECLEALDLKTFNDDMARLLNGETIDVPVFNFITGEREYKGNMLKLGEKGMLIVEGIHALNDQMSYLIPSENKFKIYISALTTLNVDNHNRIPTTDARLIRRMVRDYQTRGASANRTLGMWDSVRRGEEKYIFPFQEGADAMFNSALIYELAALKSFAEPMLFSVTPDTPEYVEARRLIKFLDYFLSIDADKIPYNSLIREFIGGSCF